MRRLSWRRLARDARGTAAVEFAFVMPLMVVLYLAVVVIADGVMASRNLSNLTRTLVDLTSKQPTSSQASSTPAPSTAVTSATLDGILAASQTLIYPQPTAQLQMTISAIDVTNTAQGVCCSARVRWSYSNGGALRPCGQQMTAASGATLAPTEIPASLLPTGATLSQPMSYLVADTSYTYLPIVASDFAPSFNVAMTRNEISMPRSPGQVIATALPASGTNSGAVCY